ncbi:hypothetical protein K502DRAFT_365022 [Neoconidiobolus thromboides FSU 785]|nr:hypothetical protein K502DRAFT_365022 [Neoconidiobolus thromboides FSU 785]
MRKKSIRHSLSSDVIGELLKNESVPSSKVTFKPYQREYLTEYFKKNKKPNKIDKQAIAIELNVTIRKVNNWFQNARQKSKSTILNNITGNGNVNSSNISPVTPFNVNHNNSLNLIPIPFFDEYNNPMIDPNLLYYDDFNNSAISPLSVFDNVYDNTLSINPAFTNNYTSIVSNNFTNNASLYTMMDSNQQVLDFDYDNSNSHIIPKLHNDINCSYVYNSMFMNNVSISDWAYFNLLFNNNRVLEHTQSL